MPISAEDFYSALSHSIRLRAILLLQQEEELCVCELIHALDIQQPVVSRHLALLKSIGLVESRKSGLWVYYRISQNIPDWIVKVLLETYSGLSKQSPYSADSKKLQSMQDRPVQSCS